MGIRGLSELIREEAPDCITRSTPEQYRGRVLAIDSSVSIYQFLSAMPKLINRHGQNISVLQGLFNRTVYLLEIGIKPVYVFDGRPPDIKRPKPNKHGSTHSNLNPGESRAPKNDLLFPSAPGEAEATCAALVTSGLAWGTVTEDMDALPFGSTRLIRNLKAERKGNVEEYNLPKILHRLNMDHTQFMDLCILLGCDYCGKIRGLGSKKALKLLHKHGSIEGILRGVKLKDRIPPDFNYLEARRLILNPTVADVEYIHLRWNKPDEKKLVQFLSHEKRVSEKMVLSRLEKLRPRQEIKKKKRRRCPTEDDSASAHKQRKITVFYRATKTNKQNQGCSRIQTALSPSPGNPLVSPSNPSAVHKPGLSPISESGGSRLSLV
ncbi:flap endonuclease 1-like [Rhinophrynus dorsalis]